MRRTRLKTKMKPANSPALFFIASRAAACARRTIPASASSHIALTFFTKASLTVSLFDAALPLPLQSCKSPDWLAVLSPPHPPPPNSPLALISSARPQKCAAGEDSRAREVQEHTSAEPKGAARAPIKQLVTRGRRTWNRGRQRAAMTCFESIEAKAGASCTRSALSRHAIQLPHFCIPVHDDSSSATSHPHTCASYQMHIG